MDTNNDKTNIETDTITENPESEPTFEEKWVIISIIQNMFLFFVQELLTAIVLELSLWNNSEVSN